MSGGGSRTPADSLGRLSQQVPARLSTSTMLRVLCLIAVALAAASAFPFYGFGLGAYGGYPYTGFG